MSDDVENSITERAMEKRSRNNGAGVGIGLLVCGIVLLAFPNFAGLSGWPAWVFYGVGLLLLLVGIMGACMEIFGGSKGE